MSLPTSQAYGNNHMRWSIREFCTYIVIITYITFNILAFLNWPPVRKNTKLFLIKSSFFIKKMKVIYLCCSWRKISNPLNQVCNAFRSMSNLSVPQASSLKYKDEVLHAVFFLTFTSQYYSFSKNNFLDIRRSPIPGAVARAGSQLRHLVGWEANAHSASISSHNCFSSFWDAYTTSTTF